MHDLLMWLIPFSLGSLFNEFYRWLRSREGWDECPISTCQFRQKITSNKGDVKRLRADLLTQHILSAHHVNDNA